MKPASLGEIARLVGGRLATAPAHGALVTGVVIDSRAAGPGDLFAALRGEYVDGHDFVGDAFRRGAAAALVGRAAADAAGPEVVVSDPAAAIAALAGHNRDVVDPVVVGITGSAGKTSVKDLLASVVSRKFRTVAAERSFNNELGVPLTLLRAAAETEVVVCEMGSRGAGHIAELCEYARPQVGVVTNIGVTHYEQFGSREAIADAKSELIRALPEGGTAVLNADDPLVSKMRDVSRADVLTFGLNSTAWLRAESIRVDGLGRPTFRMVCGHEGAWVDLPVSGRHQVVNALGASAAGIGLGLSVEECRAGLETAVASPWRMEVRSARGVVFVNDAYNANPTSVASALETCAGMVSGGGRLIAVLGYMAELGDLERAEHEKVGALVAAHASRLIAVGERASPIATAARAAGMGDVRLAADPAGALAELNDLAEGDVVLVKASRVVGLERLADDARDVVASR